MEKEHAILVLRVLQAILAFLIMALSSRVIAVYRSDHPEGSYSAINFSLFTSLFGIVIPLMMGFAPVLYNRLGWKWVRHFKVPFIESVISLIFMLFFLSAGAAVFGKYSDVDSCSDFYFDEEKKEEDRGAGACVVAHTAAVFNFLALVAWAATWGMLVKEHRTHWTALFVPGALSPPQPEGSSHPNTGPGMQQAAAPLSSSTPAAVEAGSGLSKPPTTAMPDVPHDTHPMHVSSSTYYESNTAAPASGPSSPHLPSMPEASSYVASSPAPYPGSPPVPSPGPAPSSPLAQSPSMPAPLPRPDVPGSPVPSQMLPPAAAGSPLVMPMPEPGLNEQPTMPVPMPTGPASPPGLPTDVPPAFPEPMPVGPAPYPLTSQQPPLGHHRGASSSSLSLPQPQHFRSSDMSAGANGTQIGGQACSRSPSYMSTYNPSAYTAPTIHTAYTRTITPTTTVHDDQSLYPASTDALYNGSSRATDSILSREALSVHSIRTMDENASAYDASIDAVYQGSSRVPSIGSDSKES